MLTAAVWHASGGRACLGAGCQVVADGPQGVVWVVGVEGDLVGGADSSEQQRHGPGLVQAHEQVGAAGDRQVQSAVGDGHAGGLVQIGALDVRDVVPVQADAQVVGLAQP